MSRNGEEGADGCNKKEHATDRAPTDNGQTKGWFADFGTHVCIDLKQRGTVG
jgi:hypothetical protein